jgi:hypothetical protein
VEDNDKEYRAKTVKGSKVLARIDADEELRVVYKRGKNKWVGVRISFLEPKCADDRLLKRKEIKDFLKLKQEEIVDPTRVRQGGPGYTCWIFADRDPEKMRKFRIEHIGI